MNALTTDSALFSHLGESVRPLLSLPAAERIKHIKADKWVTYNAADELTREMEMLVNLPNSIRNPGLLITAPPNHGKSWLVNRFARRNPAKENSGGTGICVPVVLINSPHKPDIPWFLSKILTALNAPHKHNERERPLFDQVVSLCKRLDVRLIIADEISDIVDGTATQQRQFLNMLKNLNNMTERPVVLTGTEKIISAVATDEQTRRRFPHRELPVWKTDAGFISFLSAMERNLPLKNASGLAKPENRAIALKIFQKSNGRLGYIVELIQKAAEQAIIKGIEQITGEIIDSIELQN